MTKTRLIDRIIGQINVQRRKYFPKLAASKPQLNPLIEDLYLELGYLHADTDSGYCSECGTNPTCETMIIVDKIIEVLKQ